MNFFFDARTAQLEDARAASQEACERQLVTAQAAAELRLTDFLAEAFAEANRRWKAASTEEKIDARAREMRQTPEEYGADIAPDFLDILKEVAARRGPHTKTIVCHETGRTFEITWGEAIVPQEETFEPVPLLPPHPSWAEFQATLMLDLIKGMF